MEIFLVALLKERPDISGQEVLAEVREHQVIVAGMTETADCRHCGKPITRRGDNPWRHTDPARSRGCRAATFTAEDGWDDSVPRGLSAQPAQRRN